MGFGIIFNGPAFVKNAANWSGYGMLLRGRYVIISIRLNKVQMQAGFDKSPPIIDVDTTDFVII